MSSRRAKREQRHARRLGERRGGDRLAERTGPMIARRPGVGELGTAAAARAGLAARVAHQQAELRRLLARTGRRRARSRAGSTRRPSRKGPESGSTTPSVAAAVAGADRPRAPAGARARLRRASDSRRGRRSSACAPPRRRCARARGGRSRGSRGRRPDPWAGAATSASSSGSRRRIVEQVGDLGSSSTSWRGRACRGARSASARTASGQSPRLRARSASSRYSFARVAASARSRGGALDHRAPVLGAAELAGRAAPRAARPRRSAGSSGSSRPAAGSSTRPLGLLPRDLRLAQQNSASSARLLLPSSVWKRVRICSALRRVALRERRLGAARGPRRAAFSYGSDEPLRTTEAARTRAAARRERRARAEARAGSFEQVPQLVEEAAPARRDVVAGDARELLEQLALLVRSAWSAPRRRCAR